MADIIFGRLERFKLLKGMLETFKLDYSVLICGRRSTRLFQCLTDFPDQIYRFKTSATFCHMARSTY